MSSHFEQSQFDSIESVVEDLKNGKMVIILDDADRENEGDFVMLASKVDAEAINFMATVGRGLICTPLSIDYARKLDLYPMVGNNSSQHETAFTVSIDAREGITTGISAFDRALTIQKMINPNTVPQDFVRPGHIFPLIAKTGGVLERRGHTEATVDFCRLAGAEPVGVICEILNPDGTMAQGEELFSIAKKYNLKISTIELLVEHLKKDLPKNTNSEEPVKFNLESFVNFPTKFGEFHIAHFRNFWTQEELTVIVKGEFSQAENERVLVRLHSECLTGDVFQSFRCDCGDQLQYALSEIEKRGKGLIFYLRQEGRGIGLSNKLKAYALQDQGHDTVEANLVLGLPADARVYDQVKDVFDFFHIDKIELMTNNPKKIDAIVKMGFDVTRFPVKSRVRKQNLNYLSTKIEKMGHDIDLNDENN